jgi:hypothetical protein
MALNSHQMKFKLVRLYRENTRNNPSNPFYLNFRQFKTLSGKYHLRQPYIDEVCMSLADDGYFQIQIPTPEERGGYIFYITRIELMLQDYEQHQIEDHFVDMHKYKEGDEDY